MEAKFNIRNNGNTKVPLYSVKPEKQHQPQQPQQQSD